MTRRGYKRSLKGAQKEELSIVKIILEFCVTHIQGHSGGIPIEPE